MSKSGRKGPATVTHAPFARPLPPGSALLTPVVASIFQELRISVAVWTKREALPEEWYPIHVVPNIAVFEKETSLAPQRYAYNYRSFDQVLRDRAPVLGAHAGFRDLFLPVGDTPEVRRVLVAGPFVTKRPTSTEILAWWYALARSRGRLSDPSFAQYLSAILSTLTLEGPLLDAFQRLLASFAGLVSGEGNPIALAAEAEAMRHKLFEARFTERMWETARGLVDDRTTRTWVVHDHETLAYLGVRRAPEHVLVGSLMARESEPDPLDELLRCHAFQRASTGMARKIGDIIAGQAGDHGVVFLAGWAGSKSSTRSKLGDLAARASSLARRFGLHFCAGASPATGEYALPARYRAALSAAEQAASRGLSLVYTEPRAQSSERGLRKIRSSLTQGIEARPHLLHTRFEQYIDAAVSHAGHRLESLKSELDSGLERLTEPLIAVGALDEKSFDDMSSVMERAAARASTVSALVAPYRQLISEIQAAVQRPTVARQDRGTRRAIAFIRDHFNEPLTLLQISRVAGFAPSYFSKLFKRNEGVTFQGYMLKLRIARAAEMLKATSLSIERTRQLSGFRTRGYFNRAFKQAMGVAPIDYRTGRMRSG